MKKQLFRLLAVFTAAFCIQNGYSQQIDSTMAAWAERAPVERIHVHFDKNMYNKEETIFYKVYLAQGGGPSGLSKNVYVEWYDTTGRMLKQTVAPLYAASAKGSFEIPSNYTGNFLRVRAYTRWMLNDDPVFAYEKILTINTNTNPLARKPIVYRTRVEAFPEGGTLIQDIQTRIAFKATNQFGNPVFVKALLVNDKNKILDTLKVRHDGMGSFILTPAAGESYAINWTDENGKTGTTPVAVSKTQGSTIAVTMTNDKALIRVNRTQDAPDNFKKMNLLVHMDQLLLYKISLNASEKLSLKAEVPIDELPTGILQFSLFSADWIPLAERIVFVNNHLHEFNAKVEPALANLGKRGKNVIEISVNDTAMANMSISVTDAAIATPDENTIYSDMLLSSDLRGKIHNPGYYLASDADSVTANLDLVMLTNGWRKFDWDKIKAGMMPQPKYAPETDFMHVTGKVLGMKSISQASPLLLNLIIVGKDSSKHFAFIPVQKDGSFEEKQLFFYDTARIYYSFNGNKQLTDVTQVQLENGLLRQVPKTLAKNDSYHPMLISDSLARIKLNYYLTQQELLKKQMASTTLQEVIVKSRTKSKEQILDEKYATGLFSGGDAVSFDLTDDPTVNAYDIFTYLQGKVAGLQVTGNGPNTTLSWRGGTPDLYLNETKTDVNMVSGINVRDIAMIKVFRPPFFGSFGGGAGGAIAIYSKKGSEIKGDPNARGLENTVLGGYSRFKEFYSPDYESPNSSSEPDFRSTLYWNPFVITNRKSPRVRVQFFNNDVTKRMQVVLEGMNSEGKMVRVVKYIE